MTKKLIPTQKIQPDKIQVGDSIEVHANRLASFKATVSRCNIGRETLITFDYSGVKNDYFTAKRVADRSRIVKELK